MPSDQSQPQPKEARLNHVRCSNCDKEVDDRAPACPNCGAKIYVEHPADTTPIRNPARSGVGRTNLDED